MISRKSCEIACVLVVCLLVLTTVAAAQPPGARGQAGAAAAQQGGRGGGAPAPAPTGGAVTTAPLGWLIGTTGEVSHPTPWADPLGPSTDTYYLERPQGEEPPDEFLSNPDREFDWHDLKSWNYPSIIRSFKILGNRRVAPGQSVQFECILEDFSGTQNGCSVGYYGPWGRRSTLDARLTPTVPGGNVMRGTMTIPASAEPGTWRAVRLSVSNGTRSGKIYWADTHPAGANLDVEVLPVNNGAAVDVMPPDVAWVRMNNLDQPETAVRTQRIQDPIPIFAKITDNKSGAAGARVKVQGPQSACLAATTGLPAMLPDGKPSNTNPCRFLEFDLQPIVGRPDIYGAWVSAPQWWQPGEYVVYSFNPRDKAGQDKVMIYTTSPSMKSARINLTNDPANVDVTPPQLLSVWLDRTTARLGDPVTVNAIVVDDKSGVSALNVAFNPIPSYASRASATLKPVSAEALTRGGAVNSNLWSGTLTTNDDMEPDEWKIERITGQDGAENKLDLLPEYHPELDVRLTFTGGKNLYEAYKNMKKGMMPGASAPAGPRGGGGAMAGAPPAGGAGGTAPAAAAAGPIATSIGLYNPTTNQITMPTGRVVDVTPGARPDPLTGKIRRIDMIPPHPPRGACLNCHEP